MDMQRLIRTLKEEEVNINDYQSITETRDRIGHFITQVYHQKLGVRVFDTYGISTTNLILTLRNCGLNKRMHFNYCNHANRKETNYKTTGKVIYDEFFPRHSKSIIDKIDYVLAKHYGFTDEELDFIINYDIKYRMGLGN